MTALAPCRPTVATTMSAAVVTAPGRVEMQTAPVPTPGPQQVLVRLEGCGVCASNLPPWEGRPWFTYPMAPGALGHEGWGRIEEIGSEVREFAPGHRVAILSGHAYAQYDLADEGSVILLPDNGEPFPAEPLGCAMNIFRRSGITAADTVAIVGVGFLGALLVQLAVAAGARVIAIARRQFARQLAVRMGATRALPMESASIGEMRELTGGRFCDVVIEAAGKQASLDLAAEVTRERGRLVVAGYHQDGLRQVNMQLWNWRGLDVINAHERDPRVYLEGMRAALEAAQSGRINPAPLYTHHFPLNRLADALDMTAARPEGLMKALITP